MLTMIIDGVIVLLLLGSIAYGYSVSRKVRFLMTALKDMEKLVVDFSTAVEKSENSVHQMRENIQVAKNLPQHDRVESDASYTKPTFSSGRKQAAAASLAAKARQANAEPDRPGVVVMRNKEDLVRKFFDASPAASGA